MPTTSIQTCFMRSCTRGRTNPPWYLACCRCAWWRAWHHFAMCRHTLLAQRFPLFFFCSIFGLFVANFFFSMALFESCGASCTGNVLNHSPKPKATCPPMVWWLSILIGFAPLCRGGVHHACKGRAHGGSCCGMFKVPESQIPQQTHVPCGWCWGAHNVAEGCGPIMAGLWPAVAGPQSMWPGCGPLCF